MSNQENLVSTDVCVPTQLPLNETPRTWAKPELAIVTVAENTLGGRHYERDQDVHLS
jgi:hypothetical protein